MFVRPRVNPFYDTFATTNSFKKQFVFGNQSNFRVRKERINNWLIGLTSLKILRLKTLPSWLNKRYSWRMSTKLGMFWVTHKSVTVPVGRDMKILTTQRTVQIAGFVIMPSEKKLICKLWKLVFWLDLCPVCFVLGL